MKPGYVISAVIVGSAAAAIGLAPLALADTTVQSAANLQQPFVVDSAALLFHNH